MWNTILSIASIILPILAAVVAWVFKDMIFEKIDSNSAKIDAVRDDFDMKIDTLGNKLADHKLYAANNFATKLEVKDMTDRVLNKLDKIDEKLDKKADKPHG